KAEGALEVEPYCFVNDLGRETIPGVANLVHPRWATRPPRTPQAQSAVTMPFRALALRSLDCPQVRQLSRSGGPAGAGAIALRRASRLRRPHDLAAGPRAGGR